jgi:hypothetical protein
MTSCAHDEPPLCTLVGRIVLATLLVFAAMLQQTRAQAQSDGFDPVDAALIYHKLTGEPLDLRAAAEQSDLVRRASNFDRPDAVKAETARLQAQLDAVDPQREFRIRVNDSISQYDHERGEFSIMLFAPAGSPLPTMRKRTSLTTPRPMRLSCVSNSRACSFGIAIGRTESALAKTIR